MLRFAVTQRLVLVGTTAHQGLSFLEKYKHDKGVELQLKICCFNLNYQYAVIINIKNSPYQYLINCLT